MPDLNTDQPGLIAQMLTDTLEQMAFVSAWPAESDPPPPERPVHGLIEFGGDGCGRLELLADERLGAVLSANALASTTDDPEAIARAHDAIGEVLNIACGAMLHEQASAGRRFEMRLPRIRTIAPEQWIERINDGYQVFEAEGLALAVRWSMER